ncbi:MAG: Gfo/Idh/MocA family oxidoreductase [Deltaproteobacteria bacterium]|nr:Gfo/Idh/MocA family oxidoreductase [Deltaproteobacteria bacterium]
METKTEKIRYAVVGAGNIAQVAVLPAFAHASENSELVALISSDDEKRKELGRKYGIEAGGDYDQLEQVLEDADVDAVYIALPNHLHRSFTERCARAGVHVLCEKPMALSVADCEAMIDVTRDAGVKLMVAYRLHFEEGNLSALQAVRDGIIGDPKLFSSVFTHDVKPGDIRTSSEAGGGALYDLGPYCVNAARSLFGDEPIEVFGWSIVGRDPRFAEVDETTTALLRFPDDRIAQFTVGQSAASVSEYRIAGDKGDLRLDPAYDFRGELRQFLTVDEKTATKTFEPRDQFAPELVYFSQCILDDEDPEPSGEEGLCDVRVLEAITESTRTSRPITLPRYARTKHPDPSQEMKKPPAPEVEPVKAPSPSR